MGQSGVDRKHLSEGSASLIETPEMGTASCLNPESGGKARLVMQSTVGPFDRLFEALRGKMSNRGTGRI